jgi:hypothetical protein
MTIGRHRWTAIGLAICIALDLRAAALAFADAGHSAPAKVAPDSSGEVSRQRNNPVAALQAGAQSCAFNERSTQCN